MKSLDAVECPSWFWVLLGIALVRAVPSAPLPGLAPEDLSRRIPYFVPEIGAGATKLHSVCRLRQVPGVGQVRALAIVRARWQAEREGREFVLLDVPGIGPSIAGQIAVWSGDHAP